MNAFPNFEAYRQATCETLAAQGRDPRNGPFEWRPQGSTKTEKGVLLVHGLLDSAYKMRDIARFYVDQGFLVRAILLPGHGTQPENLLDIHHEQWIELTRFGIQTLKDDVKEVHACGFSTGATLLLNHQLIHQDLKSLTLIAPALKMRGVNILSIMFAALLTKIMPKAAWIVKAPETDPVRYNSIPLKAVEELFTLSKLVLKKLKNTKLTIPLFVTASAQDNTVEFKPILKFFLQSCPTSSQFLYFSSRRILAQHPRITYKNSAFPEEKILDLSHIAIPNSPNNEHYGRHGDYRPPVLKPKSYLEGAPIYFGEVHLGNLKLYAMQRITYNPGFPELVGCLKGFLEKI